MGLCGYWLLFVSQLTVKTAGLNRRFSVERLSRMDSDLCNVFCMLVNCPDATNTSMHISKVQQLITPKSLVSMIPISDLQFSKSYHHFGVRKNKKEIGEFLPLGDIEFFLKKLVIFLYFNESGSFF